MKFLFCCSLAGKNEETANYGINSDIFREKSLKTYVLGGLNVAPCIYPLRDER